MRPTRCPGPGGGRAACRGGQDAAQEQPAGNDACAWIAGVSERALCEWRKACEEKGIHDCGTT